MQYCSTQFKHPVSFRVVEQHDIEYRHPPFAWFEVMILHLYSDLPWIELNLVLYYLACFIITLHFFHYEDTTLDCFPLSSCFDKRHLIRAARNTKRHSRDIIILVILLSI